MMMPTHHTDIIYLDGHQINCTTKNITDQPSSANITSKKISPNNRYYFFPINSIDKKDIFIMKRNEVSYSLQVDSLCNQAYTREGLGYTTLPGKKFLLDIISQLKVGDVFVGMFDPFSPKGGFLIFHASTNSLYGPKFVSKIPSFSRCSEMFIFELGETFGIYTWNFLDTTNQTNSNSGFEILMFNMSSELYSQGVGNWVGSRVFFHMLCDENDVRLPHKTYYGKIEDVPLDKGDFVLSKDWSKEFSKEAVKEAFPKEIDEEKYVALTVISRKAVTLKIGEAVNVFMDVNFPEFPIESAIAVRNSENTLPNVYLYTKDTLSEKDKIALENRYKSYVSGINQFIVSNLDYSED